MFARGADDSSGHGDSCHQMKRIRVPGVNEPARFPAGLRTSIAPAASAVLSLGLRWPLSRKAVSSSVNCSACSIVNHRAPNLSCRHVLQPTKIGFLLEEDRMIGER